MARGRWHAADGKSLLGSGTGHTTRDHLIAIVRHHDGHVTDRISVDAKTTEVPELRDHLTTRDLTGMVLTLDALHTCTEAARTIVEQGGHYRLCIKANTPKLHAALAAKLTSGDAQTWAKRTAEYTSRGHGRIEKRTVRVARIEPGELDIPHAAQVMMTIRRT